MTVARSGSLLAVVIQIAAPRILSREDLAAVMLEAVVSRRSGLRFDLCAGDGAPTTDLDKLLDEAKYPWAK